MPREYIDSMPDLHATWLSRLRRQRPLWPDTLPSQCAVCHRWPGPRICRDCRLRWAADSHRCQTCALPLPAMVSHCGACLAHPPRLAHCSAALDYAYPWQDLITRYKFQADLGLVRSLGRLMAEHPDIHHQLQQCDALLPIPASDERLRERGFDHTLLLAQSVTRQAGGPTLLSHVVQRQHIQLPQHSSSRAQRLRQLRSVFSVKAAQQSDIAGRKLLLLDDVMTTGATLDALAACLLSAGAASVSAIVLARTP
ncbi:ComF family protein [Comamonas testosteroni]|uniref:ComF family protein n=1 Tax=Comamonas testosteroni TaxID=285 RepID=A0A373FGS6_COMTE|nr:ComF family protein [Comamonas testosteroni]